MKQFFIILFLALPSLLCSQGTMDVLQHLYVVQKGETAKSIALAHGVTVEALQQTNPDIDLRKGKIKKGTLLTIPLPETQETFTIAEVPEQIQLLREKYDTVRIGVLFPFEEKTERSAKLLEFYRGMLMAVDSVKNEGTHIDIHTLHCGNTEEEINRILQDNDLSSLHVIFGPIDQAQVPTLSAYCQSHSIRLVIPFSAPNVSTTGNPLLYLATPAQAIPQQGTASLVGKLFTEKNFVILETHAPDARGGNMIETLRQELGRSGIALRTMPIDGDDFAIESALNQFRPNVIVPNNTSIKTLNLFFSQIKNFQETHPQYKITLLGYPEWQTYTNTLLREFYAFDTYIYSTFYRNPLSARTSFFERQFNQNFQSSMGSTFPRYGMMGFDIAYYFIHGLAQLGDTFEEKQGELRYTPYQSHYKFQRDGEGNGFLNRAVMLIHYTQDQTIEITE